MTNTKAAKLSGTMEDALAYFGRGVRQAHLEPEKRTLGALERRGLIEWSKNAEFGRVGSYRVYDVLGLWDVTVAGWAWLKANLDMDRPADAGRLSLEDALEYADRMREETIREGATDGPAINWPDADTYRTEFLGWVREGLGWRPATAEERALDAAAGLNVVLDAGRLSLEDALAEADTLRANNRAGIGFSYDRGRADNWPDAETYRTEALDTAALNAAAGLTVIQAAQALTDAKDAATLEREQNRPQWTDVLPLSSRFRTTQERQAADRSLIAEHKTDADRTPEQNTAAAGQEQNPVWDEHLPLLPQRTPGVALANTVGLIRRLEQSAHALTLHQALAEAYTPTGQVTCKHGRGLDDTCDGCTADQEMVNRTGDAWRATVGRQRGAGVWPEDARAPFVEHNALGQVASYRGVPVPADVAETWDSYGAVSWARGVESAHRDPGKFVCPVCHWSFRDSGSAENHFRGHFRNGGSRG